MSRIGDYNLQLQEQANELGYETVQEALDDGCKIEPVEVRLITPLEQKIESKKDELKKAHEAWLEEREEVLSDLKDLGKVVGEQAVKRIIDFIEKGEI